MKYPASLKTHPRTERRLLSADTEFPLKVGDELNGRNVVIAVGKPFTCSSRPILTGISIYEDSAEVYYVWVLKRFIANRFAS